MSDTVKLIIEISNPPKNDHERWVLAHGIPLDDVKVEIEEYRSTIDRAISEDELKIEGMKEAYTDCLKILDNIGKAKSEVKSNETDN